MVDTMPSPTDDGLLLCVFVLGLFYNLVFMFVGVVRRSARDWLIQCYAIVAEWGYCAVCRGSTWNRSTL